MAVIQRGSKHRAEFVLKGHRYIKSFDSHDEAVQWEALVRLMVASGKPVPEDLKPQPTKRKTVRDAYDKALKAWKGSKNWVTASANAKDALDFFGSDREVCSLTPADRDNYIEHLKARKIAIATVNRKLAALSKMLALCRDEGEHVPLTIKQFKEPEGRVRFLTDAEEAVVLADFHKHEGQTYHDFVAVALDTGGRLSELLAMEPRWIRKIPDGSWLLTFPGHVTKSGKSRTIPLTGRAVSILINRLDKPKVWPEGWNKHTITHAWARMRKRLKMQGDVEFVFHACRHTCATRLLETTNNLVLVRDWLGHSDIRVTTRYTKVVGNTLLAGAAALNRVKSGGHPEVERGEKQGDILPVPQPNQHANVLI